LEKQKKGGTRKIEASAGSLRYRDARPDREGKKKKKIQVGCTEGEKRRKGTVGPGSFLFCEEKKKPGQSREEGGGGE